MIQIDNIGIGKKLYAARKEKRLSRAKLGEYIGVHETTIKRYEDGEIKRLDTDKLNEMAKLLEIDPNYLMGWTSSEEVTQTSSPPTSENAFEEATHIYDDNFELIKSIPNAFPVKPSKAKVPLYGSIAAGLPIEMNEVREMVGLPDEIYNRWPNAFFLEVVGDSMSRIIPEGAWALLTPKKEAQEREVVAVTIDSHEITLKRFFKTTSGILLEPESHNPEHKSQFYDCTRGECDEIHIIGKLVWYMVPFDMRF